MNLFQANVPARLEATLRQVPRADLLVPSLQVELDDTAAVEAEFGRLRGDEVSG